MDDSCQIVQQHILIYIVMENNCKKKIVLTGPPGIGKTTIVKSVCTLLRELGVPLVGFYTDEVRKNGNRIGFDIIDLDGTRGCLARISEDVKSPYNVGKYTVHVQEFENMIIPLFDKIKGARVVVLDEIGKMELYSKTFSDKVQSLFRDEDVIILTSIPICRGRPIPFVEEIRSDPRNKIHPVNLSNRNKISQILVDEITSFL